ncbi:LD-carboxypeptidase [Actinomycetes bacterium KLBMP 9797]
MDAISRLDNTADGARGGGLSRRRVFTTGAAVAGGALAGATLIPSAGQAAPQKPVLRPPALRPGDRVRVVAPGSSPDPTRMAQGIAILQGWGLVVEVAPHVYDKYGYLAATDANRLADLNAAFRDPGVRGVFAARGGYGTQRIVDGLDTDAARRDPRVVVGFSDITSLQGKLWRDARLVTFYGPMVNWDANRTGPASAEALRRAVMTTDTVTIHRDPAELSAAVEVPGKATGTLRGGCLSLVHNGYRSGDWAELDGAILFFEDVDEEPYRYDGMLTHLRRVGALDKIAGVAIGQITNSVGEEGEWDAAAVLRDRLGDLGVPVLGGLPLGHGPGQLTVPLGAKATIDTAAGTLTVQPGVRTPR